MTLLSGGPDVPLILPPDHRLNPVAAAPAGGNVYAGTGYVNSGILPPPPAPLAARTFALKFPKPGAYAYRCLIHDELGMKGTITVLAARPAGLPTTGGIPRSVGAGLGLLGLALIGGGTLRLRGMRSSSGAGDDRRLAEARSWSRAGSVSPWRIWRGSRPSTPPASRGR